MDAKKKKRLEAKGWRFGDYADLLGMSAEEKAVVEMRLAAKREIERLRASSTLSQAELARRMGTKQPNVSRLFRDLGSASLDMLVRLLLAFGLDRKGVAAALAL